MQQRFLDFSDIPLAAAASLGLLVLELRRRLIVLVGSVMILTFCHLGLIVWSAQRFTEILARTGLNGETVDTLMTSASTQVTGFGNMSSVLTLGVVGVMTVLIGARGGLINRG